ncbi:MAG: dicarboxylate/amino acid:cation symporter [Oligoflexales bacterium]|nr:dicarboxylate/amino acid:cation symporter [Oligoflexales bacterium]
MNENNKEKLSRTSLTFKIVLALFAGLASGIFLKAIPKNVFVDQYLLDGLFLITGKMFIASLKMLVVPLVFVSLVCGVCGLDDVKNIGKLGGKTLLLYLITTSIAITLALFIAFIIGPGDGFNLPIDLSFTPQNAPAISEIIINLVPSNPIKSAADGKMLQIIVFAILIGIGISTLGKDGKRMTEFFSDANKVLMQLVNLLMFFAPFGVFALITRVFAKQGFAAIMPLSSYFLTVLGILMVHLFLSYSTMLLIFARINPFVVLKKMRPTMMFAFSTASSNASIPITMKTVCEKLGVPRSIASFTVPLGATINMDGTAIMQGVATVFIAGAYGIDIGVSEFLMVIFTATLASIGTAGVPGVGLITLAMVLRQAGLPVEGIGLIMGVDRLLDMARTAVNVFGDAAVSCVVAKTENRLDYSIYSDQPTHSSSV